MLRTHLTSIRAAAAKIGPDAATIGGGSIFLVGVWMVYDAAAVMLGGLLILAGGVAADLRARKPKA